MARFCKKPVSSSKEGYQRMLQEFLKKRKALRVQLGGDERKKNVVYHQAVKPINHRISVCKRAIKRYNRREFLMQQIAAAVEEFTGIQVKGILKGASGWQLRKGLIGRWFFTKCALESGLRSPDIARFTGGSYLYGATLYRKKLIQRMKQDPELRALYQRFLAYFKEQIR